MEGEPAAPDEPIDEARVEQVRRLYRRGSRVEAKIYLLRAMVLDEAASLEHMLHLVIRVYFDIAMDRVEQFNSWVLSQMTVAEKIETFRRIGNAKECEFSKALCKRLEDANTFRNHVAHSTVSLMPQDDSLNTWSISSNMLRRTGTQSVEIDPQRLRWWVNEMSQLGVLLLVFFGAIVDGRPHPFDATQVDWDALLKEKVEGRTVVIQNKYIDEVLDELDDQHNNDN